MKNSLVTYFWIILSIASIHAQDCSEYDRLTAEGDLAFYSSNYEIAIKRYNLAMINCPKKIVEVQAKILYIFEEIEKLKNIAEEQKRVAEQERNTERAKRRNAEIEKELSERKRTILEIEKAKVDSLLNQKQNLENIINSFYFQSYYPVLSRETLTDKKEEKRYVRYGFKDNFGNTKIESIYEEASQFDNSGYAKAKRGNTHYLIDILGREYLRADSLNQLNNNDIVAIDLRSQEMTSKLIANSIFSNKRLKIILLDNNKIDSIPKER